MKNDYLSMLREARDAKLVEFERLDKALALLTGTTGISASKRKNYANAQAAWWARLSPAERSAEARRRAKVRAANRAAKHGRKGHLTPAGRKSLKRAMTERWADAKAKGRTVL